MSFFMRAVDRNGEPFLISTDEIATIHRGATTASAEAVKKDGTSVELSTGFADLQITIEAAEVMRLREANKYFKENGRPGGRS